MTHTAVPVRRPLLHCCATPTRWRTRSQRTGEDCARATMRGATTFRRRMRTTAQLSRAMGQQVQIQISRTCSLSDSLLHASFLTKLNQRCIGSSACRQREEARQRKEATSRRRGISRRFKHSPWCRFRCVCTQDGTHGDGTHSPCRHASSSFFIVLCCCLVIVASCCVRCCFFFSRRFLGAVPRRPAKPVPLPLSVRCQWPHARLPRLACGCSQHTQSARACHSTWQGR